MVSVINIGLLGFCLSFILIIQAKPSLESVENKLSKNKHQLYEIYKTMRADPRLISVSNNDLVAYIYRNFVYGNNDDMDYIKEKSPNKHF
jgi:uncharacterized protein (DUF608 family)